MGSGEVGVEEGSRGKFGEDVRGEGERIERRGCGGLNSHFNGMCI